MDRTIITLLVEAFLATMQVKQHFDIKKLNKGVSQLLGELSPQECIANNTDFYRLLFLLRKHKGQDAHDKVLAILVELSLAERNVFRSLVASRRSKPFAYTTNPDELLTCDPIDAECIEFLSMLADMPTEDALNLLRTGIGLNAAPGHVEQIMWYTKRITEFTSDKTATMFRWVKDGAVKTHAVIFDPTPKRQSIITLLLGKLLFGGTDGSMAHTNEIAFLEKILPFEGNTDMEA